MSKELNPIFVQALALWAGEINKRPVTVAEVIKFRSTTTPAERHVAALENCDAGAWENEAVDPMKAFLSGNLAYRGMVVKAVARAAECLSALVEQGLRPETRFNDLPIGRDALV